MLSFFLTIVHARNENESPYNHEMRMKAVAVILCLGFCGAVPCFPQLGKKQQEITSHSRQAHAFLKENRPDLAVAEFRAIVALDPTNVDAQGNLGVLLFFQGDYAEAIAPLREALRLQPKLSKIQALLGMAEKRTGDYSTARNDLAKAFPEIKEEKVKIESGMELIELYSATGELEKAARIVDSLAGLFPTDPQVLYTSYRIHSDLAAQSMLSLSMVAPNSALMHQVMAHELAMRGETDAAIENYREALKLDPTLPGAHFELGELLKTSGTKDRQDQAKKEYEAALAIDKFDEKSETRLGEFSYREGNLEQARAHYSRAVQLQPNDADAKIGLAKVLAEMKQPGNAIDLLERALSLDPTNDVAHYRLGMLYRQAGRSADSAQQFQEYKKYKEMKDKLDSLYQEMHVNSSKLDQEKIDDKNQ